MRQFYEAWQSVPPRLSTALRALPWSAHLHLLGRRRNASSTCAWAENRWPVRELERQIRAALFERAVLNPPKVSTALRQLQPQAESHFKDAYARSRTLSPTLIAEYQTRLPDKRLLQAKLHEFYALNAPAREAAPVAAARKSRGRKA